MGLMMQFLFYISAHQLDITNKVIEVLTPVEEITKNISADTAPISVIIPLLGYYTRLYNKMIGTLEYVV